MSRIDVRDLAPADLESASRLLSTRLSHAHALSENPGFAARDTAECRKSLEKLASGKYARGAIATAAGEPVGFLFAERNLTAPDSPQAYFSPAFSVASPLQGHAVAPDRNPGAIYRALYAHLAGDLVRDGFLDFGVGVLASEHEAHDAWVNLGFGRHFTLALRGVEPLAEPSRGDVEIREATEKELPDVFALLAEQRAFHARAPMFLPDLRILHGPQEEMARSMFGQPRCPIFIAWRDREALGMQLFAPRAFVSWPVRDEGTVYLFHGVVRERERGSGVGASLLEHSLAWMRREGVTRCGLHYLSANPSGSVFWTRHGFRPAEHYLHRAVDARMAWSAR